ncbi:O-antigen ligase family protein [Terrabacter sp. C0L_2]|uniref:O-antigen ligase family protein n=1 Tax=Terrabacter sp. C0L_2 TaxID=3108389 RepID=UPI002ED3107F|nr:O-antigen ligase family protein [Terrabacter sp. C0L_2]
MTMTYRVDRAPVLTSVRPPYDLRTMDDPYFEAGPRRVGHLLVASLVVLSVLVPSGPGNTALADVGILAFVVSLFVWMRRKRLVVTLPYALPVGIMMLSGAVAAYLAHAESAAIAVLQDLFCLVWGAAVANAVRHRRWLLQVLLRTWVWSGVGWAAVMCFGRMTGIDWLAGVTPKDGGRASLTFDDPNLAANYFLVILALVLATSVIRRPWARVLALAVLLLAIVFTGSNGATLALAALVGVGGLLRLRRRFGVLAATSLLSLGVVALALVSPYVSLSQIRQSAADSAQVLRDSLGRTDESSGSRQALASETLKLYLEGDLVGVGPGRTKATLKGSAAPYVKEAHNDYLATIVERGAAGGVGLTLLIAAVAARLGRTVRRPQTEWVRMLVPRPEFLLGLGCAFLVSAFFYEVLHFRHLWAFLGLVAGIDPGAWMLPSARRRCSR